MKIIDRYIIGKYLSLFISILIGFVIVFCMINWIDMNDKFANQNAEISEILKFYFFSIPYVTSIMIAFCGLLAALLTFSGLGKYNELIALQAAGVSQFRFILPVLISSFFISIAYFIFDESIGVPANIKKEAIWDYEIYNDNPIEKSKIFNDLRMNDKSSIIFIKQYNRLDSTMHDVTLQLIDDQAFAVKKIVFMDTVRFIKDLGWLAKRVYVREMRLGQEKISFTKDSNVTIDDIKLTVYDLAEKRFDPKNSIRFLQLSELDYNLVTMSKNGQSTQIVEYEIYNAYFYPLSIFFMTFIGSMMGSIYRRGGIMIFFFLCVFLCLIYVTIMAVGKILGQSNVISPLTGALLPHILSIVILWASYIKK